MSFEYLDLLEKKLDDRQKKVCCRTQNSVVAAGAGSGKTQVLATRFAWLVMSCDIPASKILTLTFTKKAAGEMYDRIYHTLEFFANNPATPNTEKLRAKKALSSFGDTHIQTLDSYCVNVVRQVANRYGIRPDFSVGSADAQRIVKDAALPFVLKYRNTPAIQYFTDPGRLQNFAEDVLAYSMNNYASIADADDFFTSKLNVQCQKVAQDFNYLVFSKKETGAVVEFESNLRNVYNTMYSDLKEAGKENSYTQKMWNALGHIESIHGSYKPVSAQMIAGNFDEKLLLECEELSASVAKFDLREKGYIKSVNASAKELRNLVAILDSMLAFVRQYNYTKELFTLFDAFHVQIKHSKKVSGLLSFRDVQKMALCVLREQDDLRDQENAAYDKIMIDEFQDNNGENRELLFLISSDSKSGIHPDASQIGKEKLFFVGDEKQSIYKFRGADVSVFNSLQKDFKNHFGEESVLPMEYNYRSENALITSFNLIFGGTNGIFDQNKKDAGYEAQYSIETKKYDPKAKSVLPPEHLSKQNVKMHFCILNKTAMNEFLKKNPDISLFDEKEQLAYYIAVKIDELIKNGTQIHEIAILDRSRSNRSLLIKWLNIFSIPYSLDQNSSIFDSGLVYDLYNFLRICAYPSDKNAYAAYLTSPLCALSISSMQTILAVSDKYDNFDDCKKELEKHLSSEDFALFKKAHDFYEQNRFVVLSEPLTKTLELLWYKMGYRYETFLNERAMLCSEQFDLLYELARQCDSDGKSVAWFVDQLAILYKKEKNPLSDDADMDASEVTYPIEKEKAVQILTIHKSKGLQYKHVFVYGCFDVRSKSDGSSFFFDEEFGLCINKDKDAGNYFFNLQKKLSRLKELAEFRRLVYVAITRAIEDVYIVGGVAIPSQSFLDEKPDTVSLRILEKQLELYYPNWHRSDVEASVETLYEENAPFDLTMIKAECVEQNISVVMERMGKGPAACRSLLIESFSDFFKNSECEQTVPEDVLRATPSSFEKGVVADAVELSKQDEYSDITKIIEKYNPKTEAYDPDSAYKSEYEGTLSSANFSHADFGTIAHAYLEAYVNGIDVQTFEIDSKFFKNLSEAEFSKVKAACVKMSSTFAKCSLGLSLEDAKKNSRFVKAEYAFRTQIDGTLITGSIDLIYENADGTYTIVDYKSDAIARPGLYYLQQKCYRTAASRLLNCSEDSISCYLYYLRYDEFIEI